jgi:hypothetical protein
VIRVVVPLVSEAYGDPVSGKTSHLLDKSVVQLLGSLTREESDNLEGHIRHHVLDPKRKPNSEQRLAADEVLDMVKTYLR